MNKSNKTNKFNNKNKNTIIKCRYCGSTNCVKHGKTSTKKDRYLCKNCNRNFSLNDDRVKHPMERILLAITLLNKNISKRSIQKTLQEIYKIKLSFSVLDRWFKTFGYLLDVNKDKIDIEMARDDDSEDNNNKNNNNSNNDNNNSINNKNREEGGEENKKENKDRISNNSKDNAKDNNNKCSITNNNNNINNNNDNNNYNNTNGNITEKNKPKPKPKTIDILELDELYSYFYDLKKNEKRGSKYGLLLIGTEIKLLHLK